MAKQAKPFDPLEYLDTPEARAAYLSELKEEASAERMTEAQIEALFSRIESMSEAERLSLDSICSGLTEYMEKTITDRGYTVPNRIVALACADVLMEWERMMWERS